MARNVFKWENRVQEVKICDKNSGTESSFSRSFGLGRSKIARKSAWKFSGFHHLAPLKYLPSWGMYCPPKHPRAPCKTQPNFLGEPQLRCVRCARWHVSLYWMHVMAHITGRVGLPACIAGLMLISHSCCCWSTVCRVVHGIMVTSAF